MSEQMEMFKIPFLNNIKKTVKSLEEAKFTVKEVGGQFSVRCKSVVVVGPLPGKNYAQCIAEELNAFINERKKSIEKALEKAEKAIFDAHHDVIDSVISQDERLPDNAED